MPDFDTLREIAGKQPGEKPVENPCALGIPADSGTPPVKVPGILGTRIKDGTQKGVVTGIFRAGQNAYEVRRILIGLPDSESEAIAGIGIE